MIHIVRVFFLSFADVFHVVGFVLVVNRQLRKDFAHFVVLDRSQSKCAPQVQARDSIENLLSPQMKQLRNSFPVRHSADRELGFLHAPASVELTKQLRAQYSYSRKSCADYVRGISRKLSILPLNGRFDFQKRGDHFIGMHDETSGIATLCGHNPKLPSLVIRTRYTAAIPTGSSEIVSNYFPVLQTASCNVAVLSTTSLFRISGNSRQNVNRACEL